MSSSQDDPRKRWRGIKIHRDPKWNFSFHVPMDWKRYDLTEEHGVLYAPGDVPRTCFYVSVQDLVDDLDEPLTEADLPVLREGTLAGLENLPDCQIVHEKTIGKGSAFGFEVMLTFALDGQRCQRRLFSLYRDRQQFTIYGQGVPAEEYEVFHHMLGFMYTSFTFGDPGAEAAPGPPLGLPPG